MSQGDGDTLENNSQLLDNALSKRSRGLRRLRWTGFLLAPVLLFIVGELNSDQAEAVTSLGLLAFVITLAIMSDTASRQFLAAQYVRYPLAVIGCPTFARGAKVGLGGILTTLVIIIPPAAHQPGTRPVYENPLYWFVIAFVTVLNYRSLICGLVRAKSGTLTIEHYWFRRKFGLSDIGALEIVRVGGLIRRTKVGFRTMKGALVPIPRFTLYFVDPNEALSNRRVTSAIDYLILMISC